VELKYKSLTKRRRPHFQPLDATLFVTFRLVDSIPKSTVRHERRRQAKAYRTFVEHLESWVVLVVLRVRSVGDKLKRIGHSLRGFCWVWVLGTLTT